MILRDVAMLLAAAGNTGFSGGGPAGSPTNCSLAFYGASNNLVKVTWTDYDGTVLSQIGYSTSIGTEPTSVFAQVANGVEEYLTGYPADTLFVEAGDVWWVRHTQNGQHTAWVLAGGSTVD